MKFGYARVSTEEQNLDRQIDALKEMGADEIIKEKMTGTKADRPKLINLMDKLRKGDTVLITDLTRISRSTKDLLNIVDKIKSMGANIKSKKDTWLDTTSDNPYNDFLLTVMSGLSQLERDLTSQRTKEGLAAARARGRVGGRREKLDVAKKKAIYDLYTQKQTKLMDICNMFDISKPTLYKVVEEISISKIKLDS